eukprot:GFKZ01002433.1.p1 GENE.GFKZ01002433.1~~GFKZ01002433.1.p1  ORF type:complete len:231 (-),score=42.32 GFKZ01002433.1:890-1582(-)
MAIRPLLRPSFIGTFLPRLYSTPRPLLQSQQLTTRLNYRGMSATHMTMSLPTRETLLSASFMACVEHTRAIVGDAKTLSREQLDLISALLETSNGSRGFFVTVLSNEDVGLIDGDEFGDELIQMIAEGGAEVRDLLTKNVVMSSCMVVYYERRGETELGKGSLLTRERAVRLAKQVLNKDEGGLEGVLKEMLEGLQKGEGRFTGFVQKWEYDDEQKKEAGKWVKEVLGTA